MENENNDECLICEICGKYYEKKFIGSHYNTNYHLACKEYKEKEYELMKNNETIDITKNEEKIYKIVYSPSKEGEEYINCGICFGKYNHKNIDQHNETKLHKIYEKMNEKIINILKPKIIFD